MKTATFIKNLEGWNGDARLYAVDPPMRYEALADEHMESTARVIVSAVVAIGTGPETYIFPAKEDGTAINHLEMDGSYRGGLDHGQALEGAGYTVES